MATIADAEAMGVPLAWDTPRGSGTVKNPKNIWKKCWVMLHQMPTGQKILYPQTGFFTGANAPEYVRADLQRIICTGLIPVRVMKKYE